MDGPLPNCWNSVVSFFPLCHKIVTPFLPVSPFPVTDEYSSFSPSVPQLSPHLYVVKTAILALENEKSSAFCAWSLRPLIQSLVVRSLFPTHKLADYKPSKRVSQPCFFLSCQSFSCPGRFSLLVLSREISSQTAPQTTPHAWGDLGVAPTWPEGFPSGWWGCCISLNRRNPPSSQWGATAPLTGRDSFWSMRHNNLIGQKGFLLVNEIQQSNQPEGNPSGWPTSLNRRNSFYQWGCYNSLIGRNSFWSMSLLYHISQKESLPVHEFVVRHWPEGIPSGQWSFYASSTGRNSFWLMRWNNLIKQKEIFLFSQYEEYLISTDQKDFPLVYEFVAPHWPEGNPSCQLLRYTSLTGRKSFQLMRHNGGPLH